MDIGRIYMMYVIRLAYEYGVRVRVRVKSGLGLVGTTFKQNEYKVQMLISQSILIRLI